MSIPSDISRIQRKAKTLEQRLTKRGIVKALRAAAGPVVKEARRAAPQRTGALKRSITKKIWTDSGKSKAGVIVGAGSAYKGKDGSQPSKYLHLVTLGKKNRDGTRTTPNHFIARTQSATLPKAAQELRSSIPEAVRRELATL